jgi:hypothetical protein
MPPPIKINFQVGGVASVDQAMRSVEQATARVERISKRAYDDDVRSVQKANAAKEREFSKLSKWVEAQRMKDLRESNKLALEELKATEKSAAAKLKAEERWAHQRQQIQMNSAKIAYRIAENEVRDVERAEEKKSQARERFARGMGRTIGGSLTSLAGTAARVGGSILALGGGFGIADAVQKQFSLEHEAALFSNQSTATGKRLSTKDIMARSRSIAMSQGVDATEVAKAMNAYYAKASDAPGAMQQAELFAQLSKATGASMEDIATTAGSLRVQNPSLGDKEMRAMMLGIVGQTRHGAVDIKDLVAHVPDITATAGAYEGDQTANQKRLIGLSQIAMRSVGDSAEAATATKHLALDVSSHKQAMSAMGIKTTNAEGKLLDPAELIGNIMEKTKGDLSKLHAAGIGDRSIGLFLAEQNAYKAGGRAGVVADVKKFTEGGYTEEGLQSDVENMRANSGEKFHRAVDRVSEILQERMTPYLERFADKLPELEPKIEAAIDAFQTLTDAFIDHPIAGIGAIIALQVGKDIAAAQIGNVIAAAIAGATGTSAAGGAAGGLGKGAGVGGPVLALAALAGATQLNAIDSTVEDVTAGSRIADDVRSGKISPTQAAKMVDAAKRRNSRTGVSDIAADTARKFGVAGAIDAATDYAAGRGMHRARPRWR